MTNITSISHDVQIRYLVMFVSFNRNTACVTREAGTGTVYERGFSRYIDPVSQEGACVSP